MKKVNFMAKILFIKSKMIYDGYIIKILNETTYIFLDL